MADPRPSFTRDLVVVGCSAGGVEALPRLLQPLPADLAGTVCIVQHLSPVHPPHLVEILGRVSPLPVAWAEQGQRLERARVFVAPPDVHLLLSDDHLTLSKAARENHARPSIDKLFRSAAASHGTRVVGVLMTGMLDDGIAGLRAIRDAGGTVIVQDPTDAAFPDLPTRALEALEPDRTLPVEAIGRAIAALVGEPVRRAPTPEAVALEAGLDASPLLRDPSALAALGPQTTIACPECGGPMWQIGEPHTRRYRCYNGHAETARGIVAESELQVEAALWSAIRALHDRASTLETLATDAERNGQRQSAEGYARRAREAREHADLARTFMFELISPGSRRTG